MTSPVTPTEAEREAIAEAFHATYEHLAPVYDYKTRQESAVAWPDVPEANRKLMVHVVGNLLAEGVIRIGPAVAVPGEAPTPPEVRDV